MSCALWKTVLHGCLIITVFYTTIDPSFSFSIQQTSRRRTTRWKLQSSSSSSSHPTTENESEHRVTKSDALICGGGPAGLLSAICLAQKFPSFKIHLYDKNPSPNDYDSGSGDFSKNYLIGLGGRGITALEAFGVWEDVKKNSIIVPGRMDWTPGSKQPTQKMLTERKYSAHVLPRDLLVQLLKQHIVNNYADRIDLNYDCEVRPVNFFAQNGTSVTIEIFRNEQSENHQEKPHCQQISSSLVIASDGTARTFAKEIEIEDAQTGSIDPFNVVRYEDDNQRVYKIVNFQLPSHGWRKDLNYSVRSSGGRIIFDALPATDKGDYCGNILFRKDDEMAQANVDPLVFRAFLDETLPQFSPMLEDETVARLAKAPPAELPMFRYARPRLHHGTQCILLGDCAHTGKKKLIIATS